MTTKEDLRLNSLLFDFPSAPVLRKRIEAHICICFVAYKVHNELERVIKKAGLDLSVDKVLDIATTLITLR